MKLTAFCLTSIALLVCVIGPQRAIASCPGTIASLGDRYDAADAVFVGRAIDVTEVQLPTPPNYQPGTHYSEHRAQFEVETVFKGVEGKTVLICPEEGAVDCVVTFITGDRYLVFASRDKKSGVLRAALDGPTGPVSACAEALTYCRRVAATGLAPSVIGTVTEANPTGLDDWYQKRKPLQGAGIVVQGGGRTYEALTDSDGVYYLENLPIGIYTVRLTLPEVYRVLVWRSIMPTYHPNNLNSDGVGELEIKASAHAARYFEVTGCGSLAGTIVDGSGAPAAETIVLLVTKEQAASLQTANWNTQTFTDKQGKFHFDFVPSGEFVVVFNPQSQDAFDNSAPTFFYPGVEPAARATLVSVSNGGQLELGRIKPPISFSNVPLDISVVDPTNPGRRVMIVCTSLQTNGREHGFLTDEGGHARIHLRRGVRFRIAVDDSDERKTTEGQVEVEAEDHLAPIRFTFSTSPLKTAR